MLTSLESLLIDLAALVQKDNKNVVTFINEIPKGCALADICFWSLRMRLRTRAKMEVSTKEPLNPIKQDIKKGELR